MTRMGVFRGPLIYSLPESPVRPGDTAPWKSPVQYRTWICRVCGFIYREEAGWPAEGLPAGTRWQDVPDFWRCPDCGASKDDFEMEEIKVPESAA